jgi:DNA-binding response OmpR family regulator/HPt (histidine-containing phosphotransfer) domain-containing protein
MKILLIEDDPLTGQFLMHLLIAHHYAIEQVADGQSGLDLASEWVYDLIVLDRSLPDIDGIQVCQQLRQQGCRAPVLMLTASQANQDAIAALDAGADDFVLKPYDPNYLLARIRALLRRGATAVLSPILAWGDLTLNPASAQVFYRQQEIVLRPKEYTLLELFLRHPQRIFSRSAILDHLWAIEDSPSEGAVTNLIKDLRQRLKSANLHTDVIETVYGLGYRLQTLPQATLSATTGNSRADLQPASPSPTQSLATTAEENLQDQAAPLSQVRVLDRDLPMPAIETVEASESIAAPAPSTTTQQIMQRFQASLPQRLAALDAAEQALRDRSLTAHDCQVAQAEAHRLVGNLGTFGYQTGSDLARALEYLLMSQTPLQPGQAAQFSQLLGDLRREIAAPPQPLQALPAANQNPNLSLARVLVIDDDAPLIHTLHLDAPAWASRWRVCKTGLPCCIGWPTNPPAALC